jgi:hypothetical protein
MFGMDKNLFFLLVAMANQAALGKNNQENKLFAISMHIFIATKVVAHHLCSEFLVN